MNSKFNKQLTIDFGIIFGSMAAALIGVYFLSGSLAAQSAKIVQGRTALAAQAMAVQSLASLTHDAPIAAQYQSAIDKLLPNQYQLIGVSQWLDGIAQTHSVTATFNFQGNPAAPPPGGGTVGTAPFSITVSGSVGNITDFLKDIETQEPAFLLSLGSFDITGNGTADTLTAQGVLYFQ